jgi:hypothetical protein
VRTAYATTLAVCLVASVTAAPPRVPTGPVSPTPAPTPVDAPILLTPLMVFPIDSDVECIVLASPQRKVKVLAGKGPIVARGVFVDGAGGIEQRVIAGPFIYWVEGVEDGQCELIVVPKNGEEKDVIRRQLKVDMKGTVPVPPKPIDPVVPEPKLPEGELGLIKASRDGAAKVTSEKKAEEAKSLATAQRSLASVIAAGGLQKPGDILMNWRDGNNRSVPAATWRPWGEVVGAKLEATYKAGKLPDGKAWTAAFEEIATGLGGG